MKIVMSRVELEKNLNNGGYNYWMDKDNSIRLSDNVYRLFNNKAVKISYSTDNDEITIAD